MGVIIAYTGQNLAHNQVTPALRRSGMTALGGLLVSGMFPQPTKGKLFQALKDAQATLTLRYEFAGGPTNGLKIQNIVNRKDIECSLFDDRQTTSTAAGRLYIDFGKDRDKQADANPANDIHSMAAVFPSDADGTTLNYLALAVEDLRTIQNSSVGEEDEKYLTAFKFLTRCK